MENRRRAPEADGGEDWAPHKLAWTAATEEIKFTPLTKRGSLPPAGFVKADFIRCRLI